MDERGRYIRKIGHRCGREDCFRLIYSTGQILVFGKT